MAASGWDDAFLDEMRQCGDPPADAAVTTIDTEADRAAHNRFWQSLVHNDELVPDDVPPGLQTFLENQPRLDERSHEMTHEGERVFAAYGPEMLVVLGCYALPASYAAANGVQVLHRTSYLDNRPNRRLFETCQMLVDVMTPGGLGPKGRGLRTAQKVRLLHAAVRHRLLNDDASPWPTDRLGVPINQEDLAGTLMTFTTLVLEGLEKLGVSLTPGQQEAYLGAWQRVGRLMGVDDRLIPDTVAAGRELTALIQKRQVRKSQEGVDMTAALLDMLETHCPPLQKRVPAALMRLFLPPAVADDLEVPVHHLDELLLSQALRVRKALDVSTGGDRRRALFRNFGIHVIQLMITVELRGKRAQFRVPDQLKQEWGT